MRGTDEISSRCDRLTKIAMKQFHSRNALDTAPGQIEVLVTMITSKPARSRDRPCASHFEFISVVGDNVAGDAATRRRVRSHAMVDYRRRTAKPKRKETIAIEFDTNPLLQGSASLPLPFSPPLHEKQQSCTDGSVALAPLSMLDASRSDPFETFPIDRDRRARRLWDHSTIYLSDWESH